MPLPHLGQFDGGETIDFFSGILAIQTFRKLPILMPIKKEKAIKKGLPKERDFALDVEQIKPS